MSRPLDLLPIFGIFCAIAFQQSYGQRGACDGTCDLESRPARSLASVDESAFEEDGQYVKKVTDTDFAEKIEASEGWTVVKFTGDWCVPCQRMKPELEKLAADLSEGSREGDVAQDQLPQVRFFSLDVGQNRVISERFGIQSVPVLIVFRDGKMINEGRRKDGALEYDCTGRTLWRGVGEFKIHLRRLQKCFLPR